MQTFAIIPAAGHSKRMGRAKLLLPWGEQTLIEHVLETWRQGGVNHRVVVVHPDDQALAAVCRSTAVTVCVPATSSPEMRDSVQAGLALTKELFHPADNDAWLLAPADLPLLSPKLIRMLIDEYQQSSEPVVAPQLPSGRTGHPVLFAWHLAAEVQHLTGGIDTLLERCPVHYIEWQDPSVFADMDTIDDYHRLHNRHTS